MAYGSRDCNVDFVICLDITGAMAPAVYEVRNFTRLVYDRLGSEAARRGVELGSCRVKMILFKDFRYDADPLTESVFFNLPEEGEELLRFLDSVSCYGGGDLPECALEALSQAMRADFSEGENARHIILLISDAPATRLGNENRYSFIEYPEYMPRSFDELREIWQEGRAFSDGYRPKVNPLLILCMPDGDERYEEFVFGNQISTLERSFSITCSFGCGCGDLECEELLSMTSILALGGV